MIPTYQNQVSRNLLAPMKALMLAFVCLGTTSSVIKAQSGDAEELAKKLANPIASLISVPFQNNTDYGIGRLKGSRNTMNIQPVIPLSVGKNWNLITRWVQPIITQYNITEVGQRQSGLADAVVSGFFSPKASKNGLTWGAGPVFLVPVATNSLLASKQFGIGPSVVALKQKNGVTYGALVNQLWGLNAPDDRPKVNQMFVQPFLTYNWKSGAGLGGSLEWTQNWTADQSTLWFIPSLSGITALGKQKVSLAAGPRFNLAAPDAAKAKMGWRAAIVFLFVK